MIHKHHIIPRHMGGTDEPENLIKLTVEEHAEAHRLLYENCGRWQDKLAWLSLSGMINKEDLIQKLQSEGGKKAQQILRELKICCYYNEEKRNIVGEKGRQKTKENGSGFYNSKLQSDLGKRGGPKNKGFIYINDDVLVSKYTKKMQEKKSIEEFLKENSQYKLGLIECSSAIVTCPHCGKEGHKSAMVLHHFDNCYKITGKKRTFKIKTKICPHCGFEGGGGSMKRWHFDNCKQKDKKV